MKSKGIIIILLGTFTVVSLLLALMFSSIRNYNTEKLNLLDQSIPILGVNFGGKIEKARQVINYQYMNNNSLNIINSGTKLVKARSGASASGVDAESINFGANYSVNVKSSGEVVGTSISGGGVVGAADGGVEGSQNIQNNNSGMSPNLSPISTSRKNNSRNGDLALSTDLAKKAPNVNKKFNAKGGPPPGEGEDPPPPTPSLPIGDGMSYMFVLLVFFTVLKTRKIVV